MCGIFGIWNRDGRPVDVDVLRAGTAIQRHRGPDDEGYILINTRSGEVRQLSGPETAAGVVLPPLGATAGGDFDLGLGHRRLAIIDRSAAGHQPMVSRDRRCVLVYNGEIYNYRELRAELKGRGHSFGSDTDTEVVLAAYQEWGEDCVRRFNGMWAFALYDGHTRSLFCSRDRFGIKPLHIADRDGAFMFASEIKALVGPGRLAFEPEPAAVARFIAAGTYPSARRGETFFKGVRALPPAHNEIVTADANGRNHYYRIEIDDEPEVAPAEAVEEFRSLFLESVKLQLNADVPVGSCLSGGLDSSSIVAAVHHLLGQPEVRTAGSAQLTFSSVYHEEGRFNEREYVEAVLERIPAKGVLVFPAIEDLDEHLETVVWHQDEPFGDLSIFAQWCLMRAAKEHGVGVVLDGQGADEVLGGYSPHAIHLADLLARRRLGEAMREVMELRRAKRPGTMRTVLAAFVRLPVPGLRALVGLRRRHARPALSLLRADLRKQLSWGEAAPGPWEKKEHSLSGLLRFQLEEGVLPTLLRYEDRNSSGQSVEGRVPFLDHRVVEFAFRSGAAHRIRQGWTKWLLRSSVDSCLPVSVVWRRDKVGFGVPGAVWLRHLFERGSILADLRAPTNEFLNLGHAQRIHREWQQGRASTVPLWRCASLQMWLAAFESQRTNSRVA